MMLMCTHHFTVLSPIHCNVGDVPQGILTIALDFVIYPWVKVASNTKYMNNLD